MNEIIVKTYNLIDTLNNSKLIKDLLNSKKKLLDNKDVIELTAKFNNEEDLDKLITIKKKLYEIEDYRIYMENYNKLNGYIMMINRQYRLYTKDKGRVCEL